MSPERIAELRRLAEETRLNPFAVNGPAAIMANALPELLDELEAANRELGDLANCDEVLRTERKRADKLARHVAILKEALVRCETVARVTMRSNTDTLKIKG